MKNTDAAETIHHDHLSDAVEQTVRSAIQASAESGAVCAIETFSADAYEAVCAALHDASDGERDGAYVGTITLRDDYSERDWSVRVTQPNA